MKALIQIAALMIAGMSASAFADSTVTKAALHVDFNRMIEDNNIAKVEMKKDIDQKAQALQDASDKAEREKIIDFVDVEVGWGEAPPIVDRRYDSVGEARLYNMNDKDLESHESGS